MKSLLLKLVLLFALWLVGNASPTEVRVKVKYNSDTVHKDLYTGNNSSGSPEPACSGSKSGKLDQRRHYPNIVGGEEVKAHTMPWQVRVIGNFICGGTIICPSFVMSAAHCGKPDIAIVGEHDLENPTGTEHKIKNHYDHPDYRSTINNEIFDFSIKELEEPIKIKLGVQPVFLSRKQHFDVNYVVSGWGSLDQDRPRSSEGSYPPRPNSHPNKLMAVTVKSVSDHDCKEAYQSWFSKSMLCAGFPEGGKDSCQGDSGGPVVTLDPSTDEIQLEGVVSWGWGCAWPGCPGVYSNIPAVIDWIDDVTESCNMKTCGHPSNRTIFGPFDCMSGAQLDQETKEKFFPS